MAANAAEAAQAGQHDPNEVLIGMRGYEFISQCLSETHPRIALQKINQRAGLQHPLCKPLLGLVDQLGVSRYEAHKGMLHAARAALLARVQQLDKVQLERLLNASFPYLGIQELRDVPLTVMEKLDKVPSPLLKQLATDKQIFRDLPAKVQRQVWEFDKNLLQADALPPVGQYKYEVATVMRALAMDEFLPAVVAERSSDSSSEAGGPNHGLRTGAGRGGAQQRGRTAGGRGVMQRPQPTGITRKILRKGSRVLQVLKSMVGTSQKIYNQIVELCMVKYRDSDGLYVGFKELSYCTLRSQLLMTLHDDSNEVPRKDRCHELAWTLDAGIMNGRLTDKHLSKLEKYFADIDAQDSKAAAFAKQQGKKQGGQVQDEAESAGNMTGSVVEPFRVLGDASIILRDPSVMHLLCACALQILYEGVLEGKFPRDLAQLSFVVRMMQLAVDGRQMLRDRDYKFPEADPRLLHDVLPLLGAFMVEFETTGSPAAAAVTEAQVKDMQLPAGAQSKMMDVLQRSEVARRITQTFVLERLMRQDYLSATRVVALLVHSLSPRAVVEVFDFAGSLALRLSELVKSRRLLPGCMLWRYAVDNYLVKVVDTHMQVHEEVLRLLLVASSQLTAGEVGQYLKLTLEYSKKSRKRAGKKGYAGLGADPLANFPMSLANISDIGSDIGSDGWPGIAALKLKSSDGVRSVYARFKGIKGINEESAPELMAYLAEGQQEEGQRQQQLQQDAVPAQEQQPQPQQQAA